MQPVILKVWVYAEGRLWFKINTRTAILVLSFYNMYPRHIWNYGTNLLDNLGLLVWQSVFGYGLVHNQ